jgi:glutaredoxin
MMRRALLVLGVTLVVAVACKEENNKPVVKPVAPHAEAPVPPLVKDGPGAFVLRYFSPTSGDLIVAKEVSGVPEAARKQVLVVPDDATKQGPWLFVADLSAKEGEQYAVRVVDRFELEKAHAAAQPAAKPASAQVAAADGDVILYKTAWCGYCKKAAEYLRLKGVPYVEKDLERDAGARQDMLARAKKAGVPSSSLGGVPILYIKGRVLSGFSREAIDQALGG